MLIFIIPAYNEEKNIAALLRKTKEKMHAHGRDYKVIIVDDGSSDNTKEAAEAFKKEMPINLCSYYPNKGVGEAFRQGFRLALDIAKEGDIIITKEADNTSDLNILERLISKIQEGYGLALASCYAKGGAVLGTTVFQRQILSRGANMLFKLFVPIKGVSTYSSFYRAYSYKALEQMHSDYGDNLIEENGFECMVELLIKFSHNPDIKIAEVPMVLDGAKRVGKSKMRVLKTIRGFMKVIFKYAVLYRIKRIFTR